ncbi:MAG: His/Gly/Thr/Pro-type tRNA ligase C-terminal domain-containing protein, partial [Limnobacter sp.]
NNYAHNVVQMLKKQGIRVEADLRNEKINRKIREHTMQKTPYIAVIGDAERDANQVAVRLRGNENLGSLPVEEFIQRLLGEINSRA